MKVALQKHRYFTVQLVRFNSEYGDMILNQRIKKRYFDSVSPFKSLRGFDQNKQDSPLYSSQESISEIISKKSVEETSVDLERVILIIERI